MAETNTLNLSFQAEVQIIGDNIGMQVQNIDDTTVYFIAPIEKTPSEGISLSEAIKSIADAVGWFGSTFDLKVEDIQSSIEKIMKPATNEIHLFLKTAYLFRRQVNEKNETMEFAIGVGIKFGSSEQEESKSVFAIKNLSFCVWKFETFNDKDKDASKKRREAIEKRMGIVDLASDDQILKYISEESAKALKSVGDSKKIEEKGKEKESPKEAGKNDEDGKNVDSVTEGNEEDKTEGNRN